MTLTLEQYERIRMAGVVEHLSGNVVYLTPNRACKWRVDTFFTKEPETVSWIETFNPGDVFVDVGANVGLYSIWAAKTTGARVFAFEPEALNFALLCENIKANHLDAVAYPLALSDETRVAPLYVNDPYAGGSCHTFGDEVDFALKPRGSTSVQGSASVRLDDLVDEGAIPQPDHIKIDVDGFEHRVVSGASRSILRAKSVLIEINTHLEEHRDLVERMECAGFRTDDVQMDAARRKSGPFEGVGNVIFRR